MTKFRGKTINTYADGFGTWHAEVVFPDSGYGNYGELNLECHWDSIRAAARRAIRAEIKARLPIGAAIAPVRIQVVATDDGPSTNVCYGVTFAEIVRA